MAKELGIEKAMAGLLEGASLGDFMKDGIVNADDISAQIKEISTLKNSREYFQLNDQVMDLITKL